MKLLLAIALTLPCLAQTTVADTIRVPISGALFSGRVTIAAPAMTFANHTYARSQVTIQITNGAFSQTLIPNVGATPDTTSYLVQFYPSNGQNPWKEYWRVPDSTTPVQIYQVRVAAEPATASGVAPWQINQSGATTGQALMWNGSSWVPGNPTVPQASAGTYTKEFEAVTLLLITNDEHQFNNDRLIVDCYDSDGARIEPDSVYIDPNDFQVAVRFTPAQSGSCVVGGQPLIGRTISQSFTSQTSVLIPTISQDLGTPLFSWRIYGADGFLIEPDSTATDPGGNFTVYFAAATTGRVVLIAR